MKDGDEKVSNIDLRVGGGSNVNRVAGALVKYLMEGTKVTMTAIGAGAVNQAVKALIIGRGMAATQGMDLYFVAGFTDETIRGEIKTAIRIFVKIAP